MTKAKFKTGETVYKIWGLIWPLVGVLKVKVKVVLYNETDKSYVYRLEDRDEIVPENRIIGENESGGWQKVIEAHDHEDTNE